MKCPVKWIQRGRKSSYLILVRPFVQPELFAYGRGVPMINEMAIWLMLSSGETKALFQNDRSTDFEMEARLQRALLL